MAAALTIHYKISKRSRAGGFQLLTAKNHNETDGILNSFTHEEQVRLIGKLNKAAKTPTLKFNIHLDKVMEGALPDKVLNEYTGN